MAGWTSALGKAITNFFKSGAAQTLASQALLKKTLSGALGAGKNLIKNKIIGSVKSFKETAKDQISTLKSKAFRKLVIGRIKDKLKSTIKDQIKSITNMPAFKPIKRIVGLGKSVRALFATSELEKYSIKSGLDVSVVKKELDKINELDKNYEQTKNDLIVSRSVIAKRLSELKLEKSRIEAEISKLTNNFDNIRLSELKSNLDNIEQQISTVRMELDKVKLSEIQDKKSLDLINFYSQKLSELLNRRSEIQAEINTIYLTNSENKDKLSELLAELNNINQSIQDLENQEASLTEQEAKNELIHKNKKAVLESRLESTKLEIFDKFGESLNAGLIRTSEITLTQLNRIRDVELKSNEELTKYLNDQFESLTGVVLDSTNKTNETNGIGEVGNTLNSVNDLAAGALSNQKKTDGLLSTLGSLALFFPATLIKASKWLLKSPVKLIKWTGKLFTKGIKLVQSVGKATASLAGQAWKAVKGVFNGGKTAATGAKATTAGKSAVQAKKAVDAANTAKVVKQAKTAESVATGTAKGAATTGKAAGKLGAKVVGKSMIGLDAGLDAYDAYKKFQSGDALAGSWSAALAAGKAAGLVFPPAYLVTSTLDLSTQLGKYLGNKLVDMQELRNQKYWNEMNAGRSEVLSALAAAKDRYKSNDKLIPFFKTLATWDDTVTEYLRLSDEYKKAKEYNDYIANTSWRHRNSTIRDASLAADNAWKNLLKFNLESGLVGTADHNNRKIRLDSQIHYNQDTSRYELDQSYIKDWIESKLDHLAKDGVTREQIAPEHIDLINDLYGLNSDGSSILDKYMPISESNLENITIDSNLDTSLDVPKPIGVIESSVSDTIESPDLNKSTQLIEPTKPSDDLSELKSDIKSLSMGSTENQENTSEKLITIGDSLDKIAEIVDNFPKLRDNNIIENTVIVDNLSLVEKYSG